MMRMRISRGSIFFILVISILLVFVPAELRRFVQSGPYLFTKQFFTDILARFSGPGRLRFIVQPLVAIFIGAREGRKDALAGRPPFLLALLLWQARTKILLREAAVSIRNLVAVAILLDIVSQFLIFRHIHPGAALLLGPVLIAFPYAFSRAVANRISRRIRRIAAVRSS